MNRTGETTTIPDPQITHSETAAAPASIWVRRALVVEDDEATRRAWEKLLTNKGFEAVVVADGLSALEACEAFDPEVILLDLVLPRMNGFKFLHTLRHERLHRLPPVVVITGREDEALKEKLEASGVVRFLRKPCKSREVVEALRDALGDR